MKPMKKSLPTILVVEDETNVRAVIAEYLRLESYRVVEAGNGLEAFDRYREQTPDLIITDINMPGMDGLSLIENIRVEDARTPIVVISAHSDKEKLLRAVRLNLTDYIIKPLRRNKLKSLVNAALKQPSEVQETPLEWIELGHGFAFEMRGRRLRRDEKPVELTRQQGLLLEILVTHKNQLVESADIYFHIKQDYALEYNSATVRNLIKKIRKILPETMIRNVYGSGYMLVIPDDRLRRRLSDYNALPEAVGIFDASQRLVGCNDAMRELFCIADEKDVLGLAITELGTPKSKVALEQALHDDAFAIAELPLLRSDGSVFTAKLTGRVQTIEQRRYQTVTFIDLSDTLARYAADPLTGLPTRTMLPLAEYQRQKACAIFVDVDDLKGVNDTLGHQCGDALLLRVARTLQEGIGPDDVAVRWGGDEFLLLLADVSPDEAVRVAAELGHRLGAEDFHGRRPSCCFGLDAIREDDDADTLIGRIDTALLQAKRRSGGTIIRYDEVVS